MKCNTEKSRKNFIREYFAINFLKLHYYCRRSYIFSEKYDLKNLSIINNFIDENNLDLRPFGTKFNFYLISRLTAEMSQIYCRN
jgi:hypothetical protein